jgi:hypothetical protein
METDYYLHNYDSKVGFGSWCSMGMYQRAYGVAWKDESSDGMTSPPASAGRDKFDASTGDQFLLEENEGDEAKNVQLVRKRLESQNEALCLWWKHALQSSIQQRMWMRSTQQDFHGEVRPRFERQYQPETISQYDRYFSKAWSTPVRRSHSLQHGEGGNEEGEGGELLRVVSRTPEIKSSLDLSSKENKVVQSVTEFTNVHGYAPCFDSTLKRFSDYHAKRTDVNVDSTFVGSPVQEETEFLIRRKKQYQHYLSSNVDAYKPAYFDEEKVREFERCLHDFSLSSDDVYGIHKVSQMLSFNCSNAPDL